MLTLSELRRLPIGSLVVDCDGDILLKCGKYHLTMLSADLLGDLYHIGELDSPILGEIRGDHEKTIRDALKVIDGVHKSLVSSQAGTTA